MDGFGWFILAAVAFNVVRAIMKGEKARPPQPQPRPKGAPPRARARPRPTAPPPGGQSPEELWREVLGQLQRTGAAGRPGHLPAKGPDDWEETESLEVEERVVSLEGPVVRTQRKLVDYDDEAESVVRRRIAAAEARDGAITPADHDALDAEIRASTPAPMVLTSGRDELRRAIIWREVLGPPVSLREE